MLIDDCCTEWRDKYLEYSAIKDMVFQLWPPPERKQVYALILRPSFTSDHSEMPLFVLVFRMA
jgi:hypothetical protein